MYPKHVGIIMDGNRRFSKQIMKAPWKGHEAGHKKLKEVLEWCQEFGVRELTVFAFSMQNFSRPKQEYEYLMKLFVEGLQELLSKPEELLNNGLRVRFVGRTHLLPEPIPDLIQQLEELTKSCNQYTLNIAVAYGGREEITDAVQTIAQKIASQELDVTDIDETLLSKHMQVLSEPELIIRTGGDRRTSNFLTWQSTYSEWAFVNSLWPEFSKEEFRSCLDDYTNRERRFGK